MRKYAILFAVMFVLLAFLVFGINFQMNIFNLIANDKMLQFVILNSILLVGVGIFFIVFHDRLKIYLENYSREKEI